jgi:hypothetical protein
MVRFLGARCARSWYSCIHWSMDCFCFFQRAIDKLPLLLRLVVQAGAADADGSRYQRCCTALGHELPRRRMSLPTAHSPGTFLGISIWRWLRPSARSNCLTAPAPGRPRWLRSSLQTQPARLSPLRPSSDKTPSERSHECGMSQRRLRSSELPTQSQTSLRLSCGSWTVFPFSPAGGGPES